MSNIEQVKAKIRNIAKSKNPNVQEVLQIYMLERYIDRLSISKYKNNFILKGGLLVASMIGISERTTLDMDATIIGAAVSEDYIVNLVKTIIEIDANDGVRFDYQGISKIRLNDNYSGFCVAIIASIDKTRAPLKIDITTGDVITPHHIDYSYLLMFENRSVSIQA